MSKSKCNKYAKNEQIGKGHTFSWHCKNPTILDKTSTSDMSKYQVTVGQKKTFLQKETSGRARLREGLPYTAASHTYNTEMIDYI